MIVAGVVGVGATVLLTRLAIIPLRAPDEARSWRCAMHSRDGPDSGGSAAIMATFMRAVSSVGRAADF